MLLYINTSRIVTQKKYYVEFSILGSLLSVFLNSIGNVLIIQNSYCFNMGLSLCELAINGKHIHSSFSNVIFPYAVCFNFFVKFLENHHSFLCMEDDHRTNPPNGIRQPTNPPPAITAA